MTFTHFLLAVPPAVRLVLTTGLAVGIAVGCVALLHRRIVALSWSNLQGSTMGGDDTAREGEAGDASAARIKPPPVWDLAGRVIGLTLTAFVFLVAFTLGSFWGGVHDARDAVNSETADYGRAVVLARTLPTDEGGRDVLAGLAAYKDSVQRLEWPLMQEVDHAAALDQHVAASSDLGAAVRAAEESGASRSASWPGVQQAVDDLIDDGTSRLNAIHGENTVGIICLIAFLGLTTLVLTAVFQPADRRVNLVLIGVMAGVVALLVFMVIEASNPFAGAGSVPLPHFPG